MFIMPDGEEKIMVIGSDGKPRTESVFDTEAEMRDSNWESEFYVE